MLECYAMQWEIFKYSKNCTFQAKAANKKSIMHWALLLGVSCLIILKIIHAWTNQTSQLKKWPPQFYMNFRGFLIGLGIAWYSACNRLSPVSNRLTSVEVIKSINAGNSSHLMTNEASNYAVLWLKWGLKLCLLGTLSIIDFAGLQSIIRSNFISID